MHDICAASFESHHKRIYNYTKYLIKQKKTKNKRGVLRVIVAKTSSPDNLGYVWRVLLINMNATYFPRKLTENIKLDINIE